MTLSADGLQSALAQWTEEIWLECLTFDHASISTPIRLVNDTQDLVRSAGTFIAFPFRVQLAPQDEARVGSAQITATNVDQRIVRELRAITDRPTVTYELVRHAAPNTVEVGPVELTVIGFVANVSTVQIRCSGGLEVLDEAFPADHFAPWNSSDV